MSLTKLPLSMMADGTDGNIITYDASGNPAAVSTGSSGQVLTSAGAGSPPTFSAVAAGMTFLNSTDFSGASSYDFKSSIGLDASSFDCYRMIFQSVIPNSDGVYAEIRTSSDGGSSYDNSAGNYEWNIIKNRAAGGNLHDNLSSAAVIELVGDNTDTDTTIGSAANEHGLSGWVDIIAPHLTTYTTFNWFLNWNTAAGELNIVVGAGRRKSAADVDAVRFIFEGGATIESGTITTYGWANA